MVHMTHLFCNFESKMQHFISKQSNNFSLCKCIFYLTLQEEELTLKLPINLHLLTEPHHEKTVFLPLQ